MIHPSIHPQTNSTSATITLHRHGTNNRLGHTTFRSADQPAASQARDIRPAVDRVMSRPLPPLPSRRDHFSAAVLDQILEGGGGDTTGAGQVDDFADILEFVEAAGPVVTHDKDVGA